jgi:hypothetical protein
VSILVDGQRYRGPAVVTAVPRSTTVEVLVTADLYWDWTPSHADRAGRLTGYVEPAGEAETSSLPTGTVMLRLPDGHRAAGRLAAQASEWATWYAFAGPAPYFPAVRHGLEGHYLVAMGSMIGWQAKDSTETIIQKVSARVGITATRTAETWFCADLTDAQRAVLRQQLGVAYVEQEIEGHPAPCFRGSPLAAVEGEFFVTIREGVRPDAAAARLGVDKPDVFTIINAFLAHLTEAEVSRIRRDPDVVHLCQNTRIHLDD